jgi:hypothetical protein
MANGTANTTNGAADGTNGTPDVLNGAANEANGTANGTNGAPDASNEAANATNKAPNATNEASVRVEKPQKVAKNGTFTLPDAENAQNETAAGWANGSVGTAQRAVLYQRRTRRVG